jgi:alpha-1,3-rhamnosyl/mannosyltransferase
VAARIGVLATGLTGNPSGARTRLLELLAAHQRHPGRHDLVVAVTTRSGLAGPLQERGVEVDVVDRAGTVPRLVQAATARRWVRRHRLDLVHAETFPVPVGVRVPRVLTLHDERSLLEGHGPGVVQRLTAAGVRAQARGVDQIVTVSEAVVPRLAAAIGRGAPPIAVVPNAVASSGASPEPTEVAACWERYGIVAPFVLALGHLEPRKNLVRLVQAAGAVARTDGELTLVLAGTDHGAAAEVRAAAASIDRVRLVIPGRVTEAERAALLASADCLAAPSLLEGFGIVPLEAMAVGCPVLVSTEPPMPDVAGGAAELVDPRDVADIARGLRTVLFDEARRAELVARGRERAAEHSWPSAAARLHDVYDAVLRA